MKLLMTLSLTFLCLKCFSQVGDTTLKNKIAKQYVSNESFRKVISNTFAQVASGDEKVSALTNYASLEPLNGKFTLNGAGSITGNNALFLTFNVSGDIIDNVSKIFENSKLNTNASFNLKLHARIGLITKFYYTGEQYYELQYVLNKIKTDSTIAIRKLYTDSALSKQKLDIAIAKKNSLSQEIKVLQQKVSAIEAQQKPNTSNFDSLELAKFNLRNQILANAKDTAILKSQIDSFMVVDSINKSLDYINRENDRLEDSTERAKDSLYAIKHHKTFVPNATVEPTKTTFQRTIETAQKSFTKQRENAETTAAWNGFRLGWFTLRANPTRTKYYTYDSTAYFANQVNKHNFDQFYIGGEFNLYYWTSKGQNTQYFNLGIGYKKSINLSDLETRDVSTDYGKKDSSGQFTRKYTDKYTTYNKDSVVKTKSLLIYSNYYWFFSKEGNAAIHLFPEYDITKKDSIPNVWNAGIGLLVSLKNKKDDKTIVNIEAFYKALDLTDEKNHKTSLWKRNEIGLSFSFPLVPSKFNK